MGAFESRLKRNALDLRFEKIAHAMRFLEFRDLAGGLVAHKHMVMDILPAFIGVYRGFGNARDFDLFIGHSFNINAGRSIKTAGPHQTSKLKIAPVLG